MRSYFDFVRVRNLLTAEVGTDGWCSPRHRMPFKFINEGSMGLMDNYCHVIIRIVEPSFIELHSIL